jgi:hypothetical protein
VRARLLALMRRRRFFNLELHGIDLADATGDGLGADLVARQPDLRRSLDEKLGTLESTLEQLALDYEFWPLREVATHVQREGRI